MTYKELIELQNGLHEVKKYNGVKFAIFVAKNLKLIEDELKVVKSAIPDIPKEYVTYVTKVRELQNKYKEETDPLKKKILDEDYRDLVKHNLELINEVKATEEEFLIQETNLELLKINEDDLPDITGEELLNILPLVNDGESR